MTVHPRVQLREGRAGSGAVIRVLIYAPLDPARTWIDGELASEPIMVQIGFSVEQTVSALIEDPPPRPQILVADVDAMAGGEILHLHVLREQGWFGRIIALGNVPPALRSSLAIEHTLCPPFVPGSLRDVILSSGFIAPTTKLPIL